MIAVRKAVAADASRAAWRSSNPRELSRFSEWLGLRSRKIHVFVAHLEKQVVGYGVLRRIGGTAELAGVYVHPRYRRQGVGRLLAEARVKHARELGAARVAADFERPSKGVEAYSQMGFRKVLRGEQGFGDWHSVLEFGSESVPATARADGVVIRPAVKGDLQRLKRLVGNSDAKQVWRFFVGQAFHNRSEDPNNYVVFVAEKAGRAVGFACASRSGDNAFLKQLFVHPNYRHAGIGELLTKARLDHARGEWDSRNVFVLFSPSNREAGIRHYRKFGFKATDGRERHDAVLRLNK